MHPKIVIADDEAHIRFLIEQSLEELEDDGVELLFAEDGQEALSLIQEEAPGLVFLDVMMPHMNGLDVCRAVKESPDSSAFIVMLTAKGQESDLEDGQSAGADLYLTKPFDPDLLLEKARGVLELP